MQAYRIVFWQVSVWNFSCGVVNQKVSPCSIFTPTACGDGCVAGAERVVNQRISGLLVEYIGVLLECFEENKFPVTGVG